MPEDETLCFVLEDEEGNEKEYEVVGTFEAEGKSYIALMPMDDPAGEVRLLSFYAGENDEVMLEPMEDDSEYERAAALFEDLFNGQVPVEYYEIEDPKKENEGEEEL